MSKQTYSRVAKRIQSHIGQPGGAVTIISSGDGGVTGDYLPLDGTGTMAGNLDMGGNNIDDVNTINGFDFDDIGNASHARQHNITSTDDHTITSAQFGLVGATATNTIGILTPSSAPGAAEAILKSTSSGGLTLPLLAATTSVTTPLVASGGGLKLAPATGNVGIVSDPISSRVLNMSATLPVAPSGEHYGINARTTFSPSSTAPSGAIYGSSMGAFMSGSTDFSGNVYATQSVFRHNGSGDISTVRAIDVQAGIGSNGGDITSLTLLNLFPFRLSGTITNLYGLYVNNVTHANNNYAIYTNSGLVMLGDDTTVSGDLDVDGTVYADTSLETPLITTATNADLLIDPAGNGLVQFPIAQTIGAVGFDSSFPITGWQINEVAGITGKSALTIGNIQADELAVRIFVADETRVDRGDEYWTKSYGIVAEDFVLPTMLESTVDITFEDSPALTGAIFSNNDWLLIRRLEIDAGLTLFNAWGQVTGYTDNGDGTQTWTFTLKQGPTGVSEDTRTIAKGSLAIDFGATGAALIHLSVIDPTGAPYIKMRRWEGANPYTPLNYTTYVQIGDLTGISNTYVTPDGYGLYIRSTAGEDKFIIADDNGLQLRGTDLTLYDGGTQTVNINAAGDDVWIGLGSADKRLHWNGTTLTVTGQIIIQNPEDINTGDINNDAGWTVGATWGTNISNQPSELADINSTEGSKLSGIENGATAGATWGTNLNSIPTRFGDAPTSAGLYLTPTHLGYYNGSAWKAWIASSGQFYFGGSSGAHLQWSGRYLQGIGTDGSTPQWQADSQDGVLYFGGGAGWLDEDGLNINIVTTGTPDYLRFMSGGTVKGSIGFLRSTGPTPSANDGMIFDNNESTKFRFTGGSATEFEQNVYVDGFIDVTGNITVGGTVDGVDIAAFKSAYDSHTHAYLPLTGGTLTGTVNSRSIIPTADNTYNVGGVGSRIAELHVVELYTDTIVGTPDYEHSHSADDITSGELDDALLPGTQTGKTFTSSVKLDADSTSTYNYLRWDTDLANNKRWDLVAFAHDYATTAQRNDMLLTYYDGSTTYDVFSIDSGTRIVDFDNTPTVNGTAVSLSGHTHSYLPLSGGTLTGNIAFSGSQTVDGVDISAFKTAYDSHNHDSRYYTETEVNSLLTGYMPTSWTITAGGGLSGGGSGASNRTISHADTSSQESINNFSYTVIQDVTLDDYGHVTGLASVDASSMLTGYLKADGTITGATSQAQVFTNGVNVTTAKKYLIDGAQVIYRPNQASFLGTLYVGDGGSSLSYSSSNDGRYNTAFGIGALLDNSTGSLNNAMGYNALRLNTTGTNNSAIGYSSLAANTTGINNNAIGASTLAANTTGSHNNAVGTNALQKTTTGASNNAIGTSAMRENTTGNQNSAIGANAAYFNTTGSFNTAVGNNALNQNSTGSSNTAIGYSALRNTLGGGNVAIGVNAGFNETGSNKLYIANSNTSTPLIYGDFAAGYVTIHGDLTVTDDLQVDTDATIDGTLTVAPNTDVVTELGNAKIGYATGTDTATFSHYNRHSSDAFALAQYSDGSTMLNAANGQYIDLGVNGLATATINAERVNPRSTVAIDLGDYNRKYRSLFAAELYVETLVAQDVLATIGGRIMVAPTTKLTADVVSGDTTIDIEHNNLASGDYIYLSSARGGTPQIEAMKITSGPTSLFDGDYRYSVTRNLDGTGANDWDAGDAVVSLGGAAGEGYIDLTSTSTIHNHFGPTMTVYSRTATTNWDDVNAVVSVGNLRSFVDYVSDEFGLALGNDLTLTPTTGFSGVTADASNGLRLFNTDIALYDSGTQTVNIDNTGTDVWFGTSPANKLFVWDGSSIALRSNGADTITLSASGNASIAGVVNIGASGGIYQGTGTFASPTTGLKIWNNGGDGRISLFNSEDAVSWYDGDSGLVFEANSNFTSFDNWRSVSFEENGDTIGFLTGFYQPEGSSDGLLLQSEGPSAGGEKRDIWIRALNTGSDSDIYIQAIASSNSAAISLNGANTGSSITLDADNTIVNGDLDLNGNDLTDIGTIGEAWNNLSFATGWTNFGSGYANGQYKSAGDLIILRGLVTRASGTSMTIATLPSGYRPAGREVFNLQTSVGDLRVDIQTDGNIVIQGGSFAGTWVSLSGIIFSTI